jgi:5-methylcytosine-specific restriction protein A
MKHSNEGDPVPHRPAVHNPAGSTPRKRDDRPNSTARGYDWRWRIAARAFLREHPLCARCEAEGRVTAAECVDHVRPHKGDQALFWDVSNWQALCKRHHDEKTARQDGAFGWQATPKRGTDSDQGKS